MQKLGHDLENWNYYSCNIVFMCFSSACDIDNQKITQLK
jgi:hypothetical protein